MASAIVRQKIFDGYLDEIDDEPGLEDTREDWEDGHDREYIDDI